MLQNTIVIKIARISHNSFQNIAKLHKASLALNVYLWHFQDDPFWGFFFYSWVALLVCFGVCAGYSWWHTQMQQRHCCSVVSPAPGLPFVASGFIVKICTLFLRSRTVWLLCWAHSCRGQRSANLLQRHKVTEPLLLLNCRTWLLHQSTRSYIGVFKLGFCSYQQLTGAIPSKTSMNIW